jgi:hypothetical protein
MDKQDTIRIRWQMPRGELGVDSDPQNPLNASLAKLFSEKSDLDFNLSMFLFDAGVLGLRWFGVLVLTKGRRLLFFPGTISKLDRIEAYKGNTKRWNEQFEFDHISLEEDRKTWHITSPGSKKHLPKRSKGSLKTLELGEDRCLWFGFSVQSPALLKNLYRETIVTFKSPESDSERRLSEFHKARDGMEFLLMSINGDIDSLKESADSFLHFTFIVGKTGFNPYLGGNIALPHGGPYVESFQTGAVQLPSKTFMVNMSEDVAVQIICNVVPGKLAMPYSVTGQEANNAN